MCERFPIVAKRIRSAAVRLTMRRAFVREARRRRLRGIGQLPGAFSAALDLASATVEDPQLSCFGHGVACSSAAHSPAVTTVGADDEHTTAKASALSGADATMDENMAAAAVGAALVPPSLQLVDEQTEEGSHAEAPGSPPRVGMISESSRSSEERISSEGHAQRPASLGCIGSSSALPLRRPSSKCEQAANDTYLATSSLDASLHAMRTAQKTRDREMRAQQKHFEDTVAALTHNQVATDAKLNQLVDSLNALVRHVGVSEAACAADHSSGNSGTTPPTSAPSVIAKWRRRGPGAGRGSPSGGDGHKK